MKADMIQILRNELAIRIEKNSRYSMRAFSKLLGINIGSLSGLLNGKRSLTPKMADLLCNKLGLSPDVKSEVLLNTINGFGHNASSGTHDRVELDQEVYRAISDWYHWAILQLVRTKKYKSNVSHSNSRWIARQLQISNTESKLALDRLLKLKLLTRDKSGFYVRTLKENLTTQNKNVTTASLKTWQKQIREKAIASLENDPIEVRNMSSITMAINPKKIKEAKTMIDDFQEKISKFLEQGEQEQVYQLCVSLFPLQIKENY